MDKFDYILAILIGLGALWIWATIYALGQLGWLYSVIAIVLIVGVVVAIKKWGSRCSKPRIISYLAILLVCVGVLMFLGQYFNGFASNVNIRACGLCEGTGRSPISGKTCPVCGGSAGYIETSKRFNYEISNWIGVMIANAGFAMMLSRWKFVDRKFF